MSAELTREEVRDLLPAFALGILDAEERRAVESSLARFPDLRTELSSYSTVAAGLGAGVPQRPPPANLKANILSKAQPKPAPQPVPQPVPQPAWWQRLIDSISGSTLAPRFVVAALILAAVLAVGQIAIKLPEGMQALARQQQLNAILASASTDVHLDGTDNAPDAWAVIRYSRGERVAAMRVGDLEPLPADQVYQLWLVDGQGRRWSGALFNTANDGRSLVLVNCPTPMETVVRFGVSVEPAGGSDKPTGPGIMRGTLS